MANKSIEIKSPRGSVVTSTSKSVKVSAVLEWTPNFGPERTVDLMNAQKYLDSEVLRLSGPYTPKQTGMLIASGQLGTVIGSGEVIWCSPYAAAQYWNTSESRSYDAQRGSKWFERMKIDHGKQIINGAKKIGGGK
ncbi:MAG: hypothetical protein RR087_02660 [Oscillospiraceae bacterium]